MTACGSPYWPAEYFVYAIFLESGEKWGRNLNLPSFVSWRNPEPSRFMTAISKIAPGPGTDAPLEAFMKTICAVETTGAMAMGDDPPPPQAASTSTFKPIHASLTGLPMLNAEGDG